jgi:hypothetical protein
MATFGITTHCVPLNELVRKDELKNQVVTGYTPVDASESVSLVAHPNSNTVSVHNHNLIMVPGGAIIDKVEFQGVNGFHAKDHFDIGLGELNHRIAFPLIIGSTATIANEKVGGCREFVTTNPDGKNDKNINLYPGYVNVHFESPPLAGSLRVDVYFHMK